MIKSQCFYYSSNFITKHRNSKRTMSWFGFGKSTTKCDEEPKTGQALPAAWYTSPAMYELERRAIFSKKWLLVTHVLRFPDIGHFMRITEAGYTFFLIRDRQGQIRAHHNICRHRAYPIVEKDSGKASVLACKYHGEILDWPWNACIQSC